MAAGSVYDRDPVKVVIINTQYVETDAMSFKSVVQRLTGKDSKIEMDPSSFSSSSPAGFYNNMSTSNITKKDLHHHQQQLRQPGSTIKSVAPNNNNVPVMGRGLSFKDFDRLLKELPPLDELFRLCAD